MINKENILIGSNGFKIKLNNRRIAIVKKKDGGFELFFKSLANNNTNASCKHYLTHKNKVNNNYLKLSEEALEAIVFGYLEYKQLTQI